MGQLKDILNQLKLNNNSQFNKNHDNDNDNYVDDVYSYLSEFDNCIYLNENNICDKLNKNCEYAKYNTFALCELSKCNKNQ